MRRFVAAAALVAVVCVSMLSFVGCSGKKKSAVDPKSGKDLLQPLEGPGKTAPAPPAKGQ